MYRIRRPDGSLSVMVNLTRAKDALLDYEATKALSAWLPSPPERSRGHQEGWSRHCHPASAHQTHNRKLPWHANIHNG
jgi:hypothetical protein